MLTQLGLYKKIKTQCTTCHGSKYMGKMYIFQKIAVARHNKQHGLYFFTQMLHRPTVEKYLV